jgi:hypothetical protein
MRETRDLLGRVVPDSASSSGCDGGRATAAIARYANSAQYVLDTSLLLQ